MWEENDLERYQNFIIFEPTSQRIKESDIFLKGPEIYDFFLKVEEKIEDDDDLKTFILKNRLSKIRRMLDLVTDFNGIIMTKFFDRVWRRYSYLSNLGETYLDLRIFVNIFEEYSHDPNLVIATRLDEEIEDEEEDLVGEVGF
ncbi:MAG: hypothetical protein WC860_06170 [Candidatus Margulisiibacteriota bacterium]|jgi:hypothetical protein